VQDVQNRIAPKLSAHNDAVKLDSRLFARVQDLYERRDDLDLDAESLRLLERLRLDFVRAGAELSEPDKRRLRQINEELSSLSTTFSQNLLAETNAAAVLVDDRAELDGLSDDAISAAAKAAEARGLDGKFLLTFNNFTNQPQLASLRDAELRARVYRASISRGNRGGAHDNSATVLRMVKLRAEKARLLGYSDYASYVIDDQTAGAAETVEDMLAKVTPAAVANARAEAAERAEALGVETVAPQDWALATELLRKRRFDFDAAALRPYLELDTVLRDGVFAAAGQLYGLSFAERFDLPAYHPDVRVFEVFDADGSALGLFCGDFYTRDSKNGGAWMNLLVQPTTLLDQKPVVVNNLNIPKPPDGKRALLTFTEVNAMFHEFGHALHGLFATTTYPRFSGTSVPRDFVEYPSQVNEMWATWPQVISGYAKHHASGEPMPAEMVDKMLDSKRFNQGFATVEYLAAALVDLAWHRLTPDDVPDDVDAREFVERFEADTLARAGVDLAEISPRYRTTYFGHVFAGGYSAGYYSYIWSEVLDADSVEWFEDNGGLKRENGDHFRAALLSKGGSVDPMRQFRDFAGRDPRIEPLLKRRGLDAAI
ncbi:MAG: M3 family metallopeptidase, partial [Stackebrandtia sp.]